MSNSDGTDQSVSTVDISRATDYIIKAFSPHSIKWQVETKVVRNTTLRRSFMMLDCRPVMIGKLALLTK